MINPIERLTQNRIIQLFIALGYTYYGNWEEREQNSNVEEVYLQVFLTKQGYSKSLIDKAVQETVQLAQTNAGNIYERNKNFYSLLRYGVKAKENIGEHHQTVHLIDWENWDNNDFGIAEEVTLRGNKTRRPDIVLYVNGIALGVLELKRGIVDISESIRQNISNQKEKFNENFFMAVEGFQNIYDKPGLRVGMEYHVIEQLYLRGGISTAPTLASFGFGLKLKKFFIDVASSYHSTLGFSPQVSLSFNMY